MSGKDAGMILAKKDRKSTAQLAYGLVAIILVAFIASIGITVNMASHIANRRAVLTEAKLLHTEINMLHKFGYSPPHLTPAKLTDISKRLDIFGLRIVPASTRWLKDASVALDAEIGQPRMKLIWKPASPRSEIISKIAPIVVGLGAAIFAALFFLLKRHVRGIRALQESERRNRFLATHDNLTRLPNREHLDMEIDRTLNDNDNGTIAVLCLDLDNFKQVNDTHGHHAGDELLKQLSARFRETMTGSGVIARVGGDEFASVLTVNCKAGAINLARQLVSDACFPVASEGQALQVGASVGITFATSYCSDRKQLMKQADSALYQSKHSGRGMVSVYGENPASVSSLPVLQEYHAA